jgi:hypothetical protein
MRASITAYSTAVHRPEQRRNEMFRYTHAIVAFLKTTLGKNANGVYNNVALKTSLSGSS